MSVDKVTVQVLFSGKVQGVGFRFRATEVAKSYEIRGTIKNLSNGGVEAMLQGEMQEIEAFVSDLVEVFEGHVGNVMMTEQLGGEEFSGFWIIY